MAAELVAAVPRVVRAVMPVAVLAEEMAATATTAAQVEVLASTQIHAAQLPNYSRQLK